MRRARVDQKEGCHQQPFELKGPKLLSIGWFAIGLKLVDKKINFIDYKLNIVNFIDRLT